MSFKIWHMKKPRPWIFKPTHQRILIALTLFILSSAYHGEANLLTCPHEYYGIPGEVYYQDCSGQWTIGFAGIIINLGVYYLISCLLRYFYEKMKFGV